jgi:hypothetical protein
MQPMEDMVMAKVPYKTALIAGVGPGIGASRVVFRRLVWELAWLLAMSKSSKDWPMRQAQTLSP